MLLPPAGGRCHHSAQGRGHSERPGPRPPRLSWGFVGRGPRPLAVSVRAAHGHGGGLGTWRAAPWAGTERGATGTWGIGALGVVESAGPCHRHTAHHGHTHATPRSHSGLPPACPCVPASACTHKVRHKGLWERCKGLWDMARGGAEVSSVPPPSLLDAPWAAMLASASGGSGGGTWGDGAPAGTLGLRGGGGIGHGRAELLQAEPCPGGQSSPHSPPPVEPWSLEEEGAAAGMCLPSAQPGFLLLRKGLREAVRRAPAPHPGTFKAPRAE